MTYADGKTREKINNYEWKSAKKEKETTYEKQNHTKALKPQTPHSQKYPFSTSNNQNCISRVHILLFHSPTNQSSSQQRCSDKLTFACVYMHNQLRHPHTLKDAKQKQTAKTKRKSHFTLHPRSFLFSMPIPILSPLRDQPFVYLLHFIRGAKVIKIPPSSFHSLDVRH
jgi:hypothetical protein